MSLGNLNDEDPSREVSNLHPDIMKTVITQNSDDGLDLKSPSRFKKGLKTNFSKGNLRTGGNKGST
jgi:hypothetical protein|tara:strand:- start:249 stop:446 length:198 start_codon:yes stop_codon:yes gene_type:complete